MNHATLALARRVPTLVVALLGLILALTLVGPLMAARAPGPSRAIHTIFRFSCHQIPERCLRIGPGLAPVCARCQSIYLGTFLSGLAALLGLIRRPLPLKALVLLAIPCAIDGGSQLLGLRTSTNEIRVTTGFLLGVGLGLFAVPLLVQGFHDAVQDLEETQARKLTGSQLSG